MSNLNFEHIPASLADLGVGGVPAAGSVPIYDGEAGQYVTRAPVVADISGLQAALNLKMNAADAYTKTAGDARYGQLGAANTWLAKQNLNLSADGAWLECFDPASDAPSRFAINRSGTNVNVTVSSRGGGAASSLGVGNWSGQLNGIALGIFDAGYGIGPVGTTTFIKTGGSLIPSTSGTHDLGAASRPFQNLYLLTGFVKRDNATAAPKEFLFNGDLGTGTPANGLGTRLRFASPSSTTVARTLGQIDSVWTDVTDATRSSALAFSTVLNGVLAEQVRVLGNGNVGLGNTNPQGSLHISRASTNHGITLERTSTSPGVATINVNSNGALQLTSASNRGISLTEASGMAALIANAGKVFLGGGTTPTAFADIAAGTAAVRSLRIRSGVVLTTPLDGVMEYDGTDLWFTVGSTRKKITLV